MDTRNIAERTTIRIQILSDTKIATRMVSAFATIIGTRFGSGVFTCQRGLGGFSS